MSCITTQARAVAINPTRSCAPIGAMLANYGIHGAITINHGSQGCATYPRHQMARHFREPVEVASTSLTEKTTVYGGKGNLLEAIKNIVDRFHPTMIMVCSTCLSETIGDDIPGTIDEFQEKNPDITIPILSVKTPSYIGNHTTGFDNFLTEIANSLPDKRKKKGETNGKINIIPGWVNPGDIRELKHIVREMGLHGLWLTDYSETLDGGYYEPRPHFARGGTTVEELHSSSKSLATIAIQRYIGGEAARVYERRHNVPAHVLTMPIGLANTDAFVDTLTEITDHQVPEVLSVERARLLDALVDTHMFTSGLRVALFGDPDTLEGLVGLVAEMGMVPAYILTASESKPWAERMVELTQELGVESEIILKGDLHELHMRIKANPVDLLMGHSKGKFISDAEKIPLIRMGFPVEDRFGYHRRSIVGYNGAIALVDEITNVIFERKATSVVSNTLVELGVEGPTSIPLVYQNGNGKH
ncbi:MAG: nitrogenase component 1 [Chloroflexales bacterium]